MCMHTGAHVCRLEVTLCDHSSDTVYLVFFFVTGSLTDLEFLPGRLAGQ